MRSRTDAVMRRSARDEPRYLRATAVSTRARMCERDRCTYATSASQSRDKRRESLPKRIQQGHYGIFLRHGSSKATSSRARSVGACESDSCCESRGIARAEQLGVLCSLETTWVPTSCTFNLASSALSLPFSSPSWGMAAPAANS